MYADVSFSIKLQIAGWKKTPVQVRYCQSCIISKNDYLVEHVQTVTSNISEYLYEGISCEVRIEKMHTFLQYFGTHSFQVNIRVLHNLQGLFRTISNISDEVFSQKYLTAFTRCIFAEMLHHKYLIRYGSAYGSSA